MPHAHTHMHTHTHPYMHEHTFQSWPSRAHCSSSTRAAHSGAADLISTTLSTPQAPEHWLLPLEESCLQAGLGCIPSALPLPHTSLSDKCFPVILEPQPKPEQYVQRENSLSTPIPADKAYTWCLAGCGCVGTAVWQFPICTTSFPKHGTVPFPVPHSGDHRSERPSQRRWDSLGLLCTQPTASFVKLFLFLRQSLNL